MAKQRYVNTKFWSDNFISELNPLDRYLFLYFLTNEHTNIAGIYELPLKTISFETGLELDMLKKMIKRLCEKVRYVEGWVCIKNFQKHQNTGSEDIKVGIKREMSTIPLKILDEIEKWNKEQDGHMTIPTPPDLLNLTKPILNLTKPILIAEPNSADIILILDMFALMNPAIKRMYGNKTQRKACTELVNSYGIDRLKKIITETLPKTNGLQFFPTITTPLQLQDKYIQLESAIRKYQSEKLSTKKYEIV